MPIEGPEQSYFPSAKCVLVIRFDEFGDPTFSKKVAKLRPPQILNGLKDKRSKLVVKVDVTPQGVKRFLISDGSPAKPPGPAQDQASSADDLTHSIFGIVPKTAKWNQNGTRIADTLSMSLRYCDMPIDPRTVRACGVYYYLGTVTEEEFRRGIAGELRRSSGEALHLVPDTYLDSNNKQRTNLRFEGWIDTWETDWSNGAEPLVNLECRDNTSLLIEATAPTSLHVGAEKPIDEAVAVYLSNFPQFNGLAVEYHPSDSKPPVLKGLLSPVAMRGKLGPVVAQGGGGSATTKTSVWDYLTDVCGRIGHIIRVEGLTVIIEEARTLYSNKTGARSDDPYKPRSLASGDAPYRRFIYGRNVLDMKMKRVFTKRAPTNIQVNSYTPNEMFSVRFPTKEDRVALGMPGDSNSEQKWQIVTVKGVIDKGVLKLIARNAYESIGRNELQVTLKTRNLASFGGGNLDPDILDMRTGDTFEFLVNRDDDKNNQLTSIESTLLAQAKTLQFMQALGHNGPFAQAYAKAYSAAGFQTTFRTKSVAFDWKCGDGGDGGVTIDLTGMNYIEVRTGAPGAKADAAAPAAKKPGGGGSLGAAGAKPPLALPPAPSLPSPAIVPDGMQIIGQKADGSFVFGPK